MEMKDIDQVLQIDRLSFSMPWSENAYRYELTQNGRSQLWVAETCSETGSVRVVGMVVVWLILGEAHIATIAVHPDYRGLAIGKQLVVKALAEAIRQGCTEATLEVRAGNIEPELAIQVLCAPAT